MQSIRRLVALLVFAVSAVATLAAQDPLVVSPGAYRLAFENAWVKVVRVRYGPHDVLPPHLHTALASAYVYLNDGGPILFRHHDLPYGGVTRPPTRAGSFRVYRGLKEVHSVENPTDTPSEFLRVEFKTDPVDEASLKGKFFREEPTGTRSVERVQFEHAQVRISRLQVAAGQRAAFTTAAEWPALVVALSTAVLEADPATAAATPHQVEPGETGWIDAGHRMSVQGIAHAPAELLRFDFKTRPLAPVATQGRLR